MGKTFEEYLDDLTGKQMRASGLKLWAQAGGVKTGAETLERWRAGQLRIRFEEVTSQQRPPLVGTIVETVRLNPLPSIPVHDAIKLCNCRGVDGDIGYSFPTFDVELTTAVNIDLFKYNRDWSYDDLDAWAKANGKRPIMPHHLLALRIQHPETRAYDMIVEVGGRCGRPNVLGLFGGGDHRRLGRSVVAGYRSNVVIVGFLSE